MYESMREAYFILWYRAQEAHLAAKQFHKGNKKKITTHFVMRTLLFINVTYYFNWYLQDHSMLCVWQCGCRNGTLCAVISPAFTFI
jgi:hypothetical protein